MNKPIRPIHRTKVLLRGIPLGQVAVSNLFLMGMLFNVFLMTRFSPLYTIIKVLFVLEVALLIRQALKIVKKQPFLILCILCIVALRIPFYSHADGMILSSDNALEALQVQDIRENKTVPFFLFESSGHSGTYRYLFVSYFWDFFGENYLNLVLFQLLMFIVLLFILYEIFRPIVDEKILLLFFAINFVFIEVIFDYSLFLRGGRYLEMFLFFLLGVYLFDFTFKSKMRLFFSFYFLLFSIYLQPFGLFFVVPFIATTWVFLLKRSNVLKILALMILGGFAGICHLVFYKITMKPPPLVGNWFLPKFISLSDLSLQSIPLYLKKTILIFKNAFENIFGFEFQYSMSLIEDKGSMELFLIWLNRILIYISFLVLLVGLVLVTKKILSLRKSYLEKNDWPHVFFFVSFLIVLGKCFAFSPRPFLQPRHNLDLAFLIMMSYFLVFSSFLKIKRMFSFKSLAVTVLFFILTIPHYQGFLKAVRFKERSYQEILSVLVENGVKYVTTDFIIAYPLYFLSDRKILVTDSLGPVTIRNFLPELREVVDRVPISEKAYLFFSRDYKRRKWHMEFTKIVRGMLAIELREKKIKFKFHNLKYHSILIPEASRNLTKQ